MREQVKTLLPSITDHARLIEANLKALHDYLPKVAQAAESIHQTWDTLLTTYTAYKDPGQCVISAARMAQGAHDSWRMGYISMASGHSESGLTDLRRACEFVCYAAKVINNDKLAEHWADQHEDNEARYLFSSACSIPGQYQAEKFRFLWPLLVAIDFANYFGAHGNMTTISFKVQQTPEGEQAWSSIEAKKNVPRKAVWAVLVGYRCLQALAEILKDGRKDAAGWSKVLGYLATEIKQVRGLVAEVDGVELSEEQKRTILTDDRSDTEKAFQRVLEKEKAYKDYVSARQEEKRKRDEEKRKKKDGTVFT